MDHSLPLVFNITVALSIAFAGGILASWLKQSPIVGYLLAGVLIGPFTPGFVGDRMQIASLADVGVIFLMFALGVAFSLKDLARIRNVAVFGTLIQVGLTLGGGLLLGLCIDLPLFEGVFIGSALAASSSMVILKTLLDRGEIAAGHGRLLLSMSIVQDLIIVVLIVLLPKLGSSTHAVAPAALVTDILITLAKATGFIAFSFVVGLRIVPRVMAYVTRLRSSELFIVTAAVFALGAATICTLLGLSAALGAFVAGLVLSESEFDHRVIAEVVPIRDLFATLFFVSVGMLVDVSFVVAHWPLVLASAALVMLLKSLSTLIGVLPFRLTPRTAAFTALGMIPVGELNFVLAQTGLQANALSTESYKLILTSALVTIVVTPLAFKLAPRVGDWFGRTPGLRTRFDSYSNVGASGALEAHALVIGYGRVGHAIAAGLQHAGMSVVVIDARLSRVREAGATGLFAVYGNASSQTVLSAAHIENARLAVVALTDHGPALATIQQIREMNREALITARAEYAVHEPALHDAGANLVIVPELEGATALLNTTLDALGSPR